MAEKRVLLGVSGSVAAYRAADLARELMRAGCEVRVCLTDGAQGFVTPALFEALTGQPTLSGVFEEPVPGRMAHIDWARWADCVVVAPATANVIAKLAHGVADDMLTTLALATTAPLLVAPAMNPQMYDSEPVQTALSMLKQRGATVVEPSEGDVACGEHGQGKLASIQMLAASVFEILDVRKLLAGKRLLITSGPTQEPIDSVRYVTNRSSGKMGAALAKAALLMGAQVTVVSGPTAVRYPLQASVRMVGTTLEMLNACVELATQVDIVVAAAAVADYRPAHPFSGKLRRSAESLTLELIPNPDVVAEIAKANPAALVVGFAAEPSSDLEAARQKIVRKGIAAIAVNNVGNPEIGFEVDQNELVLIDRKDSVCESGRRSKLGCALWLLEKIAAMAK